MKQGDFIYMAYKLIIFGLNFDFHVLASGDRTNGLLSIRGESNNNLVCFLLSFIRSLRWRYAKNIQSTFRMKERCSQSMIQKITKLCLLIFQLFCPHIKIRLVWKKTFSYFYFHTNQRCDLAKEADIMTYSIIKLPI